MDLDAKLAPDGIASQRLTVVEFPTRQARTLSNTTAGVPALVGADLVVHQVWEDGQPDGLGVTHVNESGNTTRLDGKAGAPNAVWPVSKGESVYFTIDRANQSQLYQRGEIRRGSDVLVMNLSRSDQPDDPIVVSSDGTLVATAGVQGAPAGDGGGPESTIMIRSVPNGAQPSAAYSGSGEDPRFVGSSMVIFEQDGDLKLHNVSSGSVETVLEGGAQSLSYPMVGSDGSIWFRAENRDKANSTAWIRRSTPKDGEVSAVLKAEEWRIGRFDVGLQGDRLVVETTPR